MGTHGYLNTHGYPHSGYPRGYGVGTCIIFIQRGGDEYHTIRTYGYPLTSLTQMLKLSHNVNAYMFFKYFKKNMDVGISLGKLK